jgi:hypothetical protein
MAENKMRGKLREGALNNINERDHRKETWKNKLTKKFAS